MTGTIPVEDQEVLDLVYLINRYIEEMERKQENGVVLGQNTLARMTRNAALKEKLLKVAVNEW